MAPAGGRFCFFINTMDDLKHSKAIDSADWILCKLTVQTIEVFFCSICSYLASQIDICATQKQGNADFI